MTNHLLACLRGDWQAVANAPYVVSDPIKARHLLGYDDTPSRAASEHLETGIMPYSALMRALPRLDFKARTNLEKLLSGGDVLWTDAWKNIVVNEGLNYILGAGLAGRTVDTTWFIGLTSTAPSVAAGNTLASHSPWTEVVAYTPGPGTRQAWVVPAADVTGQSVSNAAAVAVFTINANGTVIGGAFLCGDATGTTAKLYAVGAFTAGDRTLNIGETLSVTITATAASA